jgi:hypothetical protein
MILRSVAQVRLLFERLCFSLDSEWTSADGEGSDILWATLLFRLSEGHSRTIDRVESIINADRKVATYKLALIRALCDIATASWASARWERWVWRSNLLRRDGGDQAAGSIPLY